METRPSFADSKPSLLSDARFWRSRAEEMRSLAKEMHHEHSRAIALRIADDYDHLAEQAEERAAKISK
jgi:hypothetical protein